MARQVKPTLNAAPVVAPVAENIVTPVKEKVVKAKKPKVEVASVSTPSVVDVTKVVVPVTDLSTTEVVVPSETDGNILEQSTELLAKLQQVGNLISAIKVEYRALEKKWQRELKTALELVELAKRESSLEVGVAAFPEVHPESPSMQHDAEVLRLKQDSGATFAMTQLFFTAEAYVRLVDEAKKAGSQMPIVPGLMPISNSAKVLRMAEMSGAALPVELLAKLEGASELEAKKIGMDYSVKLANDLLQAGAPGLHIFTLNYSKAALEVARGCGLA
jgi:hypothetical protein